MESEPVDILISAPPGNGLADRWALRLRTMGVTVAEQGALTDSRALLLCLMREDATRRELLWAARALRVPTVLVLAEPVAMSREDQALLAGVPVVEGYRLSGFECWRQILQALHTQQCILTDPNEKSAALLEANQFRQLPESRTEWRMAAMATLIVALACLGWWVFLKRDQQDRLRDQLGHPLLPAQPTPTPKAIPIAPQPSAPAADTAPATLSPAMPARPTLTQREEAAMALVQACILAGNRDEGFPTPKIDEIVEFFAEPTVIVGKGSQTREALKASLTVRAAEWPAWHENIAFIKVDDAPPANDSAVVVLVRSSFFAKNEARNAHSSGGAVTRYTVVFDQGDKPLISQVEATALP